MVLKKLSSCALLDGGNVLAKDSVGGILSTTMASSIAARSRLILLRHGKVCTGNHITWFTMRICRMRVAHTVKHLKCSKAGPTYQASKVWGAQVWRCVGLACALTQMPGGAIGVWL